MLTNTRWLDGRAAAGRAILPVYLPPRPTAKAVANLAPWRYDAVLINTVGPWLYPLCFLKKVGRRPGWKLLGIDFILNYPQGLLGRLRFLLRRWLLKEVDRFVFYYPETAEVRRVYSIPAERVRYVPFKANTLEQLLRTPTSDEGFFLACGRSARDYATLCAAFEGLPYACRILAPEGEAEEHGTRTGRLRYPPNVTLVSDDGSVASWNQWIARARAVVLPIKPGKLSPAGISAYLVAMALGKTVIITEGPATRGLLDPSVAVLVPPGDAQALRDAVRRVAEDGDYRNALAEAGKQYALSLGGEDRLQGDMVAVLADVLAESAGGR